jgi:hypothetical protein
VTGSDLSFYFPESHSSILAPAAEGEGSAKAGLSMEKDASDFASAIRKDTTAIPDFPPQLPSPSPVTNVATDGPSTRSLSTEHIEHHPLDPAYYRHDIV